MEFQPSKYYKRGFTLIEVIGVLAVIGLLAIFIPKVVKAVHESRIENAARSCDIIKTATADHYGKWGGLGLDGASGMAEPMVIPNLAYDQMLLKDQFLDKLFAPKIGDGIHGPTNTHIEIRAILTPPATVLGDATSGYNLGGGGTGKADVIGTNVVQAVITGVSEADARALSLWIEGPGLSSPVGQDDLKGRVKYAARSPTTVYIYLTHK